MEVVLDAFICAEDFGQATLPHRGWLIQPFPLYRTCTPDEVRRTARAMLAGFEINDAIGHAKQPRVDIPHVRFGDERVRIS